MSTFATLFGSVSDQALITTTGLDHRAFNYLLIIFFVPFNQFTPYGEEGRIWNVTARRGRQRSLFSEDCLGLILTWYRTRGSCFVISVALRNHNFCLPSISALR